MKKDPCVKSIFELVLFWLEDNKSERIEYAPEYNYCSKNTP